MSELRKLPDRTIISVTGDDAETYLKGLVTNGPPDEAGCFSALLTPQGKILFDFFIVKAPDGYFIDIHANAAEALVKRLMLYRLRAKVELGIESEYAVLADRNLAGSGADTFTSLPADTTKSGIVAPKEEFRDVQTDTHYHARRIAAGIPEWGADFGSDEVFLMDVNYDLLGGVDYKKGCFIGQEVSSRMRRKGEARRRTLIAEFSDAPPAKGTPITAGKSTIGEVMSSAGALALACVRLDRWEKAVAEKTPLECGGQSLSLRIPEYLEQR